MHNFFKDNSENSNFTHFCLTYLSVSMESCNPRADNFAISCAKIEEGGGHKKDPLEPKSNCGEYNFTQLSWKYLNVYL